MRRGILVLSGLVVILSAVALVRGAVGYPLIPWPVSLVILAMSAGTFVITMLHDGEEPEEIQKGPARPRALKQHRPRGRAKKRVVRNAMKRRRFRKLKPILLSHEDSVIHPGGEQVGFFG